MWLALLTLAVVVAQDNPADLQQLFERGEQALSEHRYRDAEQTYKKLQQLSPGTAEVYGRLGLIYFQQRKFAQAVPALRQALKLRPNLPNAGVLLAMSLSELGRFGEALPGLEKGFRQSADSALRRLAGLQLQRAYTGLQRDSKAVEVGLELTRLYPEDPEVLYHTGRLYARRRLAERVGIGLAAVLAIGFVWWQFEDLATRLALTIVVAVAAPAAVVLTLDRR